MVYGFLEKLFSVFGRHRTSIDVVTTSEISVSLTIDDTSRLKAIEDDLRTLGSVTIAPDLAIICVVGTDVKNTPGLGFRAFTSLQKINVLMVSHGASASNFTFVVRS